jgi:ornithine cyclodeaminase/alanine dehydrogenase-like protein (mu-crystallin family)
MVLYLDEQRVRDLLQWDPLITAMETALAAFSLGRVLQPVRNMLTIEEGKRYLGIMPAVADDAMGAKLVSFYPGNAGTGVATHLAMILLFRPDTGEPLAVMDGRLITEMRTAAVSAAMTKYLAAPDSHVLALLGSGAQAHAHLQALSRVRRFEEVRVWSRTPAHAERFAEQHGATAMTIQDAVRGADVIVTATNALEPILKGAWLARGACQRGWLAAAQLARARRCGDGKHARGGFTRGCPQGIRRRDPLQGWDLCRGWRDLCGDKRGSRCGDDGIQVGGDSDRRHCNGEAGLRRCVV